MLPGYAPMRASAADRRRAPARRYNHGMSSAAVPILAWHAMNVAGNDYSSNDHLAFRDDLETIHRLGLRVVPLGNIARALVEGRMEALRGCVGLTFDDGSDFDFHDLPHPAWGPQRGMANILADFAARHGREAQPALHATSFAIVSPHARAELDRTCMIGCRWWNDDWWAVGERSGLVSVESHGWDHNHDSLAATAARAPRGAFDLRSAEDAEAEIAQGLEYVRERRGRPGDVLFAYPYGEANDFLAREWLPANGPRLGIVAAFTASDGGPVTAGTDRWAIPRFVFGLHWKRPGELEALLRDAGVLAGLRERGVAAGRPRRTDESPGAWRERLRTWEVHDARAVAGNLFRRRFGHEIPDYPRHFVLVRSPGPGSDPPTPEVVAYVHQSPFEDFHLTGGMCVDEGAYRRMPKWLFEAVRREGGLATIVTRDSLAMLGDSPAAFGHVGEPRARAADLRTGFVDTGVEHLMVYWRRELAEPERRRLVERAAAIGPF